MDETEPRIQVMAVVNHILKNAEIYADLQIYALAVELRRIEEAHNTQRGQK